MGQISIIESHNEPHNKILSPNQKGIANNCTLIIFSDIDNFQDI